MNCPVCKNTTLIPHELQAAVSALKCSICEGLWLNSLQFSNWIAGITKGSAQKDFGTPPPVPAIEPKTAKICPACGHLMARYKVGHAMPFTLDRCGHCGGSWFDRNEWETLKVTELWNQVHLIFSPSWQARVRQAEQTEQRLSQLADKLGAVDFAEAQRIKAWFQEHRHREALLAYFLSEND